MNDDGSKVDEVEKDEIQTDEVEKETIETEEEEKIDKVEEQIEENNDEQETQTSSEETIETEEAQDETKKTEETDEIQKDEQLREDSERIDEYKKQIEKDNEDYNSEYEGYKEWCEALYNMGSKFVEASRQINEIIEELKVIIDSEIGALTEEQKSDVENRAKGINIIGKMFNNTVEKNLDKTQVDETLEKQELNALEDEDMASGDIITEKLNENYNHISQMKNNKQSVIKDYFNFINSYILPINDGVLSGIQYINLVEKEEINRLVLPTYIKLKEKLEELLKGLGVTEIKIQEFDRLDYAKIEVFDIEETDDEARNETIHETIRTGYTYSEDLYGTGQNHIVRTAQVTVYKYVEESKAVDQDEI